MKDFNFFSPYLQEKRNKRLKRNYTITIVSLVIIGLLSFAVLNTYQINQYKSEISKVESYLNAEQTKKLQTKYEETKKSMSIVNKYYDKMLEVDKALNAQNTIHTSLLDKLSSVMPQDSNIVSMSINMKDLEIKYSIIDLIPLAELEHNLRALDIFDKVHVSIVDADINYHAIISCRLKDVNVE
jgi:Tfp pilus assembly protein PilN